MKKELEACKSMIKMSQQVNVFNEIKGSVIIQSKKIPAIFIPGVSLDYILRAIMVVDVDNSLRMYPETISMEVDSNIFLTMRGVS